VIEQVRELIRRERGIRADRDERGELSADVAEAPFGASAADDADLVAGARPCPARKVASERALP
jgi:hypothetical protein